jgi:hypothetical protein
MKIPVVFDLAAFAANNARELDAAEQFVVQSNELRPCFRCDGLAKTSIVATFSWASRDYALST